MDQADVERLGKRRLSTIDAVGESLALGPIVTVGFLAYLIAGSGGSAMPLVTLICFAGSLALGWVVSLYARRFAGAGAVYEYVARGQSRGLGVLVAGFYFLPKVLVTLMALVTGLLFQAFCAEHLGFDPGWWTGGVASTVVVFALTYRDVRVSTRSLLTLTALSAIPFLLLSIVVIAQGGEGGNTLRVLDPGDAAVGDLFRAILFGTGLFVGFEAAACVGEEAVLPNRAIPRAILLTISIVGAFYLIVTYAATIGFGPDRVAAEWGGNPAAYAGLGDRYVGAPVGALISLGILLDALAAQIAFSNFWARGYYALARDRLLPRPLAAVSRHGTPVGGLALFALSSLAGVFAAALFEDHFEPVGIMSITFLLTILPVYVVLALGAGRLLGRGAGLAWKLPLVAAAAAVPALGVYGAFHPFPAGSARWGVWLALASVAVVAAWFCFLRLRRGERVRAAAG